MLLVQPTITCLRSLVRPSAHYKPQKDAIASFSIAKGIEEEEFGMPMQIPVNVSIGSRNDF